MCAGCSTNVSIPIKKILNIFHYSAWVGRIVRPTLHKKKFKYEKQYALNSSSTFFSLSRSSVEIVLKSSVSVKHIQETLN